MLQEGKVDLSDLQPGLDPEQLDQAREKLSTVRFDSWLRALRGPPFLHQQPNTGDQT